MMMTPTALCMWLSIPVFEINSSPTKPKFSPPFLSETQRPIHNSLSLSLPRVINIKFLLQPHQKYYITQDEELGFSYLTWMKDDHTTNSHYLTYTFLFKVWESLRFHSSCLPVWKFVHAKTGVVQEILGYPRNPEAAFAGEREHIVSICDSPQIECLFFSQAAKIIQDNQDNHFQSLESKYSWGTSNTPLPLPQNRYCTWRTLSFYWTGSFQPYNQDSSFLPLLAPSEYRIGRLTRTCLVGPYWPCLAGFGVWDRTRSSCSCSQNVGEETAFLEGLRIAGSNWLWEVFRSQGERQRFCLHFEN